MTQVVYAEGAGPLLQPFVGCCSPRRRTAPDAREDKVIDLVAAEAFARASGSRPDRRRARLRTTRAAIADSSTEMPSQDSGNFSSLTLQISGGQDRSRDRGSVVSDEPLPLQRIYGVHALMPLSVTVRY